MTSAHPHDAQIRALYASFLDGWNRRSGAAVAAGFADDGDIVGFDGTHHRGRLAIAADLRQVFASHPTQTYVGIVRSVRPIAPGVALLMAHAGMIPPGGNDLDERLHVAHTLVAVDEGNGRWRITLLQATPARFHQHPEAREALTQELRGLLAPS
ncbi:SgcJ/EcaC family oxidoreductase [Geodermatophilus marinus]|uniref:SgcJ/EcaC family oxidoreductase n=1 Tax=Geodermatophilus sp. LHW52908 TaxID=2303986 RepID=UPI000E3EA0B2|nr:SgcJ/EcaC family oxidoreductase [Geodermatophilus sp. LHW52908]RFU19398.1 SgcJ/EcaC family oxidoreductase [Geodermatophilus sp. LHW52908]